MDPYFNDAGKVIIETGKVSRGLLQRVFKIDFNRAYLIIKQLETANIVRAGFDKKSQQILVSMNEFQYLINEGIIQNVSEINYDNVSYNNDFDFSSRDFDIMSVYDFEQFCAELLRKNGFAQVEITKSSDDLCADILAHRDGVTYAIQCKCYAENIGVDAVYQIAGGMKYYDANIGGVLTNRYFTTQVAELASKIKVVLGNRDFLLKLLNYE